MGTVATWVTEGATHSSLEIWVTVNEHHKGKVGLDDGIRATVWAQKGMCIQFLTPVYNQGRALAATQCGGLSCYRLDLRVLGNSTVSIKRSIWRFEGAYCSY